MRKNILLLMSGSIACEKASQLIPRLRELGHEVNVACTPAVFHFVSRDQLLSLGARSVHSDTFEAEAPMAHIDLSRWADLMILCPATANTINKLATGIADDMISTTWVAAHGQNKPMLIVPAMNTKMYQYPATAESLKKLAAWGITVLPTQVGELACGETGEGRMLEVDEILTRIGQPFADSSQLDSVPASASRVLITAGGTREYIDGVRYIGNLSTGRTGAALANKLSGLGHQVTWLGAHAAIRPDARVEQLTYETFDELDAQLRQELNNNHYDGVIHAAAVSDYRVGSIDSDAGQVNAGRDIKLASSESLTLRLVPNPKLLNRLVPYSLNPDVQVIAFKLTNNPDASSQQQAIDRVMSGDVAAVVHNDLADISDASHTFTVHLGEDRSDLNRGPVGCQDVNALAQTLSRLLTSTDQPDQVVAGQ